MGQNICFLVEFYKHISRKHIYIHSILNLENISGITTFTIIFVQINVIVHKIIKSVSATNKLEDINFFQTSFTCALDRLKRLYVRAPLSEVSYRSQPEKISFN